MMGEFILLVLLSVCFAYAEEITPQARGYELTWSDEFKEPALDSSKWHTSYAPNVHPLGCNGEKQSYVADNAIQQGGMLILRAERKAREGMPFTSGMVASHDKFSQRYGWFEARIKSPKGKGLWPAFWMLPQSRKWPPEIDIMELKGRLPERVFLTLHERQPGTWRPRSNGKEWDGPDFTADFHNFAVEWEPEGMRWYVDGVERHQVGRHTPDEAFYLIINLAVGGIFDGDVDLNTPFACEMLVDWVRVYAKE